MLHLTAIIVSIFSVLFVPLVNATLKDDCLKGVFDPNEYIMAAVASSNQTLQESISKQAEVLDAKLEQYCLTEKDKSDIEECVDELNKNCTAVCAETAEKIAAYEKEIEKIINNCTGCTEESSFITQNYIFNLCITVDCGKGTVEAVAGVVRTKRGLTDKGRKGLKRKSGEDSSDSSSKSKKSHHQQDLGLEPIFGRTGNRKDNHSGKSNSKSKSGAKHGGKGNHGHKKNLQMNLQVQVCASLYIQITQVYAPKKNTCTPGLDAETCEKYQNYVEEIAKLIIGVFQRSAPCIDGTTQRIENSSSLNDLKNLCQKFD